MTVTRSHVPSPRGSRVPWACTTVTLSRPSARARAPVSATRAADRSSAKTCLAERLIGMVIDPYPHPTSNTIPRAWGTNRARSALPSQTGLPIKIPRSSARSAMTASLHDDRSSASRAGISVGAISSSSSCAKLAEILPSASVPLYGPAV